jgi:nicotinate-nucleotide adenylyltransferase
MSNSPTPTPLPVPLDKDPRPAFIVLFGGTFDPPHNGHVQLPRLIRDELERRENAAGRGWMVYVPAARSPHKGDSPVASDQDRVEMLRLAIGNAERMGIWTDELDRAVAASEPSYTVDTVRRAREWLDERGCAGVGLRLLVGADQALAFHRWRDPRDILRMAAPVVMLRGDMTGIQTLVRKMNAIGFWSGQEIDAWRGAVVTVGAIDVSATRVREALRSGDAQTMARFIPVDVARYIQERGLYQQKAG